MHTGYDNYWMYNNRRHERVLCFPKNDNFSHPVFTDSYKQVQNMENPSNLCNYIPPPNTVARPHQKVSNDQHRVTSSQNMWPSSVCLQPYTSSLTHDFLPNEVCSVQQNSIYGSSQPLQNQALRNVQNCSATFNPVQAVNYKASAGSVNNQNNCNYSIQTARIRVKDISSLNKSSTHDNVEKNNSSKTNDNISMSSNCDSLLISNLNQAQDKNQHYYSFDSAAIRQNRMYNNQNHREYTNYTNTALPELNHSYLNYGPSASHQFRLNNGEQYPQSSTAFYQQNAQFTQERVCCNNVPQMAEKPQEAFNKGNYLASLRKNLNNNGTQEANERGVQSNSNSNACASKRKAFNLSSLPGSSELNATSQPHLAIPANIQTSPIGHIACSNKPRSESTAGGSLHNPISSREINTFRMTIPQTAQNTASLSKTPQSSFSEPSRNSDLCLPSPSAINAGATDNLVEDEVNSLTKEAETTEARAFSGMDNTSVSQLVDQREPATGSEMNKDNKSRSTENPPGDRRSVICRLGPNGTDAVGPCERVLECSILPKEENLVEEKGHFEDESPVCIDEASVQVIKSEVDVVQDCNIEQLSDTNSGEGTELPGSEHSDADLVILKNPGANSFARTLKTSPESDVYVDVFDKTKTGFEKPITVEDTVKVQAAGNEEAAVVAGEKCKSEINRDKLDLLIKFLKKDGGPVEISLVEDDCPSPASVSQNEIGRLQNRRKLSKTCIVKNKNIEREKISLVSCRNPKYSSRSSSTENCLNETAEAGNGQRVSEGSDFLENDSKYIPKDERAEENDVDPSDGKGKTKSTSMEGKERTENSSSDGLDVTMEERNLINVMRAFQNLKSHFCASCNFTSPVNSIWINIVSGELRCLNCFKKMMLKADENVRNSKTRDADEENTLKTDDSHRDKEGNGKGITEEKSFEKKSKSEVLIPTKSVSKSEDLKEHPKKEALKCFENVSRNSEKEAKVAVNRIKGKDQCDSAKRQVADESVRSRDKARTEKSAKPNSSEDQTYEKPRKKEVKQVLDSRDRSRKKSDSNEEFVPHKVQTSEKSAMRGRCIQKGLPKECSFCSPKSHTSEEVTKKCKKHETSGRSKTECCTEQRSYKADQAKVKDDRAEHSSKRKGDETIENSKRKRMSSDEEVDMKKVRGSAEGEKGKLKEMGQPSEKMKLYKELKEDGDKNKAGAERGREEEGRDWAGKMRKSSEQKEESHCQVRCEDKATDMLDLLRRHAKKSTPGETKPGKVEGLDPASTSPKGTSKDKEKQNETKRKIEGTDCRQLYLTKIPRKESKQESFVGKNVDSTKHERKDKHCFEKRPEILDGKESPGKTAQKNLIENHEKKSKQCLISRLFKGKQNTKVNPTSKSLEKEGQQTQENRKEHRREGEIKTWSDPEEIRHHPKSSNRTVETRSDKRRASVEEPTNGKRLHQTQWENTNARDLPPRENLPTKEKKDKAVGCMYGEIMKDVTGPPRGENMNKEITYSAALLARLMKKTKKLSWSLLGDT